MRGVEFRPLSYKPFYFDTTNQLYQGVQIHVTDRDQLELSVVQFSVLEALFRLYPDRNIFDRARPEKIEMFDKVNGTDEVRRLLTTEGNVDNILRVVDKERARFMIKREKYLIYE
jgi:uncharacterized protein YbbC (DUF1343 family)